MPDIQTVFRRSEIKYLLTAEQYRALTAELAAFTRPDEYGKTRVNSLYYDTADYRLIRASLEKPVYKEKLRLRTYGDTAEESTAFIELKKKYRGIVYKRRVSLPLERAYAYLSGTWRPAREEQILREIDWFLHFYRDLRPVVKLSCERTALVGKEDEGLRITFDGDLRAEDEALRLESGRRGALQLAPAARLMEIKVPGAMPLWLTELLAEARIYPASYSKYGAYYTENILQKNGVIICA